MKYLFFIFFFCFTTNSVSCQEDELIDGIIKKINAHPEKDSTRTELIIDLAWEYSFYDYRRAIALCDEAIQLSIEINYDSGLATAFSVKGNSYRALNKHDSAYFFLIRSLDIRKRQNRKDKIAGVTQNIANVFYQEGKYADAINLYKDAIKLSQVSGDVKAELVALSNLASTYRVVGLTNKACEALKKAFEINKILNDEGQELYLYSTMGTLQHDLGNIDEAISCSNIALKMAKKLKDIQSEAVVENNLGLYYKTSGNLKMGFQHYEAAAKLYFHLQDSVSIATIANNIANAYIEIGKCQNSINESSRAFAIAQNYNDTTLIYNCLQTLANGYLCTKNFAKSLYFMGLAKPLVVRNGTKTDLKNMYSLFADIYVCMSNYKDATENLIKVLAYTDSIKSDENNQLITNLNIEMDLNSKEKEIELLNKSAEIKEIELNRQKNIRLFFIGISFLFALIFIVILFSYRRIKKANLIIENQKLQVELKNKEITHQKEPVDEKQKEIIDSINYAKRIQDAVLTGEDVWNKISKEHFILFKPKDIVSGDFYWAYNTPNNRSIFALADCTGHGVPGGFMSMLGNSFLNEIVIENKLFKADQILNKLRVKIISALEKKGSTQQKDGMDISLCVWNKLNNTLEYAGANNPLWLLRGEEIQEYKANKMPIGLYLDEEKLFSSITIQLEKGDIIYLSTDGYADQFGGEKGKKLKYKTLIESLIKNSKLDMASQKINHENAFNLWKGNHQQVDDVSLIGIKVTLV